MTVGHESLPFKVTDGHGILDLPWMMPLVLSAFLIVLSFQNYLLFHVLAELFAIIIGVLMFVIAWQTYPFSRNNFLMFLACGYFWVGAIDLVHTLVYKGMNIYPISIANPATQFWIGARYAEAVLLLAAPLFLVRGVNRNIAFMGFGAVAVALYVMVMTGNFPDAFIEGQGLTPFKVVSEYVIIALLGGALLHLIWKRALLEPGILVLLALSLCLTMLAELSFTFYVSVYGLSNLTGHIFKLFSFWLIFMAIVRVSLQRPYVVLTQEVAERKLAEQKIKASLKEKEVLINEIHHRVKNNLQVISSMLSLQVGTETDDRTIEALKESRRRVKVMARIHENLHKTTDLSFIRARDYLQTVVEDTKESSGIDAHNITTQIDVEDVVFEVDHAVACGQIVSELVSNALKHAFSNGQSGTIEVSLQRTDRGAIVLIVADDGKGLPHDIDLQHTKTLGLKLIHALVMQLGGDARFDGSDGTRVQITFQEKPS